MLQIFCQNFPQDCMELKWQDAENFPVYVDSVADPETQEGDNKHDLSWPIFRGR